MAPPRQSHGRLRMERSWKSADFPRRLPPATSPGGNQEQEQKHSSQDQGHGRIGKGIPQFGGGGDGAKGEKLAEPQGEKGGGIASPGIGQEEKQEAQGDGGQEVSPQNAAAPEMDGHPRRRKRSMARNPPQKFGVYMPKVRRGCPRKKYSMSRAVFREAGRFVYNLLTII